MLETEGQKVKELYEFGPFRLDPEKETLVRAGEPVPLQPETFQILKVLISRHRQVVTKDDLMKAVWPDSFVEETNLSRNIFLLRKALGESPRDHQYILTVPGQGYRFAESVRSIPDQEVSIIFGRHSGERYRDQGVPRREASFIPMARGDLKARVETAQAGKMS